MCLERGWMEVCTNGWGLRLPFEVCETLWGYKMEVPVQFNVVHIKTL